MENTENNISPNSTNKSNGGNKIVIVVAVLGLIVIGGFVYKNSNKSASITPTENTNTTAETATDNTMASTTQNVVKEFIVSGSNYKFEPNTISVKKGDTVKITFQNTGGMHDFKIDEFNVATQRLGGGGAETVQFVADKTGSFEYYCSVGQHRAMGMKGTLMVTE